MLLSVAIVLLATQGFAADPGTANFDRDVFAQCLRAFEEPSFETPATLGNIEAYRLLVLRSFRTQFLMRIDVWPAGTGRITWRTLSKGNCGPGALEERTRALSSADVTRLRNTLAQTDFWHLPTEVEAEIGKGERVVCTDGSAIFLEGTKGGERHFVPRWCTWTSRIQKIVAQYYEFARANGEDAATGGLILD
jgi:hypothetical protein